MKYYKTMCLVVAIDIALFSLISLFYKPDIGTAVFAFMKYCFFVPLILVSILQLAGLVSNVMRGYVNTLRMYKFVEIQYGNSPLLFFFGIAWELVLWVMPVYAILEFLAESH
jgi:hypothetical protein